MTSGVPSYALVTDDGLQMLMWRSGQLGPGGIGELAARRLQRSHQR